MSSCGNDTPSAMSTARPPTAAASTATPTAASDADAAAAAALPEGVCVQADGKPTGSIGKEHSGTAQAMEIAVDGATTATATTTTTSSRTGSGVVDGDSDGDGSSKRQRTATNDTTPVVQVRGDEEEWPVDSNSFLLDKVKAFSASDQKSEKAWKDLAAAVNQKWKFEIAKTAFHCAARHSHLLGQMLEQADRERRMISLEMVLTMPDHSFVLELKGNPSSHVDDKKRAVAVAVETEFPAVEYDLAHVRQVLQDNKNYIPSQLLQQFWDTRKKKQSNERAPEACDKLPVPALKKVPYHTEADIVSLANNTLKDAINVYEELHPTMLENLSTRMEMQLFALKPDIVVVRLDKIPILAVEVKKPLAPPDSLTSHPAVLGQAFDYLQLLAACGYNHALLVVTSIEESFACWTNDLTEESPPSSPNENSNGQRILSATTQVQSSATKPPAYANMTSPPVSKVPNATENTTTFSESPPTLKEAKSHTISGLNNSSASSKKVEFKKDVCRSMARSKVEAAEHLVWLLYRSISFAMHHATRPTTTILELTHQKWYSFPKVLQVTSGKCEYAWGSLKVKFDNTPATRHSSGQRYFIIGILGHGRTSNVYHALDTDGKQFAIKVYVKATDDDGKSLNSKEFTAAAEVATTREKDCLRLLYRDFLDDNQVRVEKLFNGFWCLVMPFFRPVPKKDRSRTLKNFKAMYRTRFLKNKLQYRAGDARWRHVGVYRDGKIHYCVLYDLAELEPLGEAEDHNALAESFVSAMQDRISLEEIPAPEPFECEPEEQT